MFFVRGRCTLTTAPAAIGHWPGLGYCLLHSARPLFCPALDSLFFPRPDQTALSPMFSTPLPCPPAIAPGVSSTPESLQATVIASRARDHLQRSAAGISSRSTTTSFTNAPRPSAELSYCFELCLHGTVLYVTQGNTRWGMQFSDAFVRNNGGTHATRTASKDLVEIFRVAHCSAFALSTCCR